MMAGGDASKKEDNKPQKTEEQNKIKEEKDKDKNCV